jgi:hypothetical protein
MTYETAADRIRRPGKSWTMLHRADPVFSGVLVAALLAALALGARTLRPGGADDQTVAQRNVTPSASLAAANRTASPLEDGAYALGERDALATAMAEGLPTTTTIVGETIRPAGTPIAEAGRPDDPAYLRRMDGEFEVGPDHVGIADGWTHDVLANFPDANLTDPAIQPLRLEDVDDPLSGPRLAISDLNPLFTHDLGVVPFDEPTEHTFRLRNAGDEDLVVSRIYTACGCTATRLGGRAIDPAGWLPEPLVLVPGEEAALTVTFDPRVENRTGTRAKYVQIYTNDPTKALFDDNDRNSHEARFRIVVEVRR